MKRFLFEEVIGCLSFLMGGEVAFVGGKCFQHKSAMGFRYTRLTLKVFQKTCLSYDLLNELMKRNVSIHP